MDSNNPLPQTPRKQYALLTTRRDRIRIKTALTLISLLSKSGSQNKLLLHENKATMAVDLRLLLSGAGPLRSLRLRLA